MGYPVSRALTPFNYLGGEGGIPRTRSHTEVLRGLQRDTVDYGTSIGVGGRLVTCWFLVGTGLVLAVGLALVWYWFGTGCGFATCLVLVGTSWWGWHLFRICLVLSQGGGPRHGVLRNFGGVWGQRYTSSGGEYISLE